MQEALVGTARFFARDKQHSASGLGQVTCISSEHGWFPHRYVVAATSLSAMSTAFLAKLDCTCLGIGGQCGGVWDKNNTE